MTQNALEIAVRQRWESGWEALHPAAPADPNHVPYTFDNESYEAAAVWAHLAVEPTVRVRTTQGWSGAKYDARGIIRVRLFGDVDVGVNQLAQLCDDAISVLEDARFGTPALIVTHEGSQRAGPSDSRWCMRVVTVAYVLEQQR